MKPIYEYFITQLNNNANGLVYDGNYIFRFFEDKMTAYNLIAGTLISDEIEFSPVTILSKTPVTFVESNKRVDWLVEIGIAVRIRGKEYDPATDLDYANIQRVIDLMQGKVITVGGVKYSAKLDKEPNYQGYQILGEYKYALLSVTLNVSEIAYGNFGQDWTVSVDGQEVDFTDVVMSTTKRFYTADNKSALTNDYNQPVGRAVVIEITLNYNGEIELLNEVMGSSNLKQTRTVTMELGSLSWTYNVVVESAPMSLIKGGVMQITLRFVEV